MSNEIIPSQGASLVPADNPVSRTLAVGNAPGMNVGAVAIEAERAIAEAQGQLTLAKRFPRSMTAATTEFMDACSSPEFAATAFYSVPNRGSGPSIRFAEEAARCYGNFQYGHRELSRTAPGPGPRDYGRSEVEVYAWDMQNNNYSKRQIPVEHVTDTKNGPRKLVDQTDIDNKIANVASKQMRGRILALLPKHMVAAGMAACKRTLAGGSEKPLRDRLIAMAAAFSRFGVTDTHLVAYLGHPVDSTTIDELGDLMGVHNAIRDGAKASEYFQLVDPDEKQPAPAAAAISQQVEQSNAQPSKPAPQPRTTRGSTKSKPAESNGKPTKSDASQKEDSQSESEQHASVQSPEDPPVAVQPSSTGGPAPSTPPVEDDPF